MERILRGCGGVSWVSLGSISLLVSSLTSVHGVKDLDDSSRITEKETEFQGN